METYFTIWLLFFFFCFFLLSLASVRWNVVVFFVFFVVFFLLYFLNSSRVSPLGAKQVQMSMVLKKTKKRGGNDVRLSKRERIGRSRRRKGEPERWRKKKKRRRRRQEKRTRVEGGVERMSVLCCYMYEYVLLSVLFIQHHWFRKCFLTKNPLLKIYSKILQKTSEVFLSLSCSLSLALSLSFSFFFSFSWIWWPVLLFGLPSQTQCVKNEQPLLRQIIQ